MSESIGTRTPEQYPLPPGGAKGGGGGATDPGGKTYDLTFQTVPKLTGAGKKVQKKSTNPVMGNSTRARAPQACSCLPTSGNLLIHGRHTWHRVRW